MSEIGQFMAEMQQKMQDLERMKEGDSRNETAAKTHGHGQQDVN